MSNRDMMAAERDREERKELLKPYVLYREMKCTIFLIATFLRSQLGKWLFLYRDEVFFWNRTS